MARDMTLCEILHTRIEVLHASRTKAFLSMENAFWEITACTRVAVLLGSGGGGGGEGMEVGMVVY